MFISASCDRPNIKLEVKKRAPNAGGENNAQASVFQILEPLADELIQCGPDFPKTIIFTKLKWCGHGYEFVRRKLSKAKANIKLVSQYHASCLPEVKMCCYFVIDFFFNFSYFMKYCMKNVFTI